MTAVARLPRRVARLAPAASLAALLALALGIEPDRERPVEAQGTVLIALEAIVTGLANPVAIANAGDGWNRLFIALQAGQILIYDSGQLLPNPFLDISSLVSCCGEQGLLGVAFHPSYASNGFFYVNYTNLAGDTVVARYRVSADANLADPASAVILLTVDQPFTNHNGGQLQFGPDGYLYIGMGDGGSGGDPGNRAQNLGELLGKLLRIDVDGGTPYAIPATNPFVGTPGARGEIWAYGLRNPWRFSFDRLTGDLFIGDVGQESREEVDFQPAGSPGGQNYGWRLMEGSACYDPATNCNNGSLTLPILEYDHSLGCAVIGGSRYRGREFPDLSGTYLYGDFCTGLIWGATETGGAWTSSVLFASGLLISAFGEDESGEVYVAHYGGGTDGAIYRITSIGTPCALALSLGAGSVRRGGRLGFDVRLTHNRPRTVEQSFLAWVEDARGAPVLSTTVPARRIRALEEVRVRDSVSIPRTLPPGTYRLAVSVGEMHQGVLVTRRTFRVVE
ncbi:MAG: PQQ-dependent sugar dehydrogenase [Candidatus Rokubacteria bacterium]|nr:PQQ-dependent sugar dehydrogenase [Candidatus Rokubacteria bacterium]